MSSPHRPIKRVSRSRADLAAFRDKTVNPFLKRLFGVLSLGWRGSARHWARYEKAYLLLAGLSTPLVLSVHTVVSFDFAVSVLPGWHATIFPPYFVAGAIYAGFAMVLTLAIPIRVMFGVQDFINSVAFGRGVEQSLVDIATDNPVFLHIVEKRHRFYLRYVERILEAGRGRIDLVLCGDDFGSQRGLLISPAAFDRLFAAKKKELFDLVHSYGAKVTHHCCGSSRGLIPRFISCGRCARRCSLLVVRSKMTMKGRAS